MSKGQRAKKEVKKPKKVKVDKPTDKPFFPSATK